MHDLLTIEEDKAAAAQGWSVEYVYDLGTDRWIVAITGSPTPHTALQGVYTRARQGDSLAIKALKLVVKSRPRRKKS